MDTGWLFSWRQTLKVIIGHLESRHPNCFQGRPLPTRHDSSQMSVCITGKCPYHFQPLLSYRLRRFVDFTTLVLVVLAGYCFIFTGCCFRLLRLQFIDFPWVFGSRRSASRNKTSLVTGLRSVVVSVFTWACLTWPFLSGNTSSTFPMSHVFLGRDTSAYHYHISNHQISLRL